MKAVLPLHLLLLLEVGGQEADTEAAAGQLPSGRIKFGTR